ncbi:MAG: glycosyltransferase, partial [Bacillota bacterium]
YYPSPTSQTPEYDVLFVGNIHQFDNYRKLIGFDTLDPVTQQLMLHARERLSAWVSACGENEPFVLPDLDPFLRQCLAEIGQAHVGDPAHWRSIVYYFRYRVAHLVLREMYVSALTEFRLGLFGRGWETFPAVARFAQPEIANGEPLREAIGRSAINLHLHTWTVHHPRLYDTAAAGGFLLVGRIPEEDLVSASFTPGSELDTFGSIAELKRKIRYYLDHPDERLAMAARAAQRARSCHTMQHRMAELVQYLSKDIDDQQS